MSNRTKPTLQSLATALRTSGPATNFLRDPAFHCLLATAFAAGFSLPLARVMLLATLVFTLRDVKRGHRRWRFPATGWAWLGYLAIALVTTAIVAATKTDDRILPAKGLTKLPKLIWFFGLALVPTLVDTRERFLRVVKAFVLGCGIEALRVLVLHTLGAWIQVTIPFPDDEAPRSAASGRLLAVTDALGLTERIRAWTLDPWRALTYNAALAKLTGMATAQRLMAGVLAALALALQAHRTPGTDTRVRRFRTAMTLLLFAGLVVALKRGPWISAVLVAIPLLVAGLGARRTVPALLVAFALIAALPAARGRIAELPNEFLYAKGGRALMWMHVVPGCRRDHPWGVGFRGLTYSAMRRYARRVEHRQNHVHSNPLQILVELGYQGLAAYLLWMALAVRDGTRLIRNRSPQGLPAPGWEDTDALLRAVPLAMLCSLMINGIVEYNFADGELVLVYGLALGLAAVRLTSASFTQRGPRPQLNRTAE